MAVTVASAPAEEPVTLAEAKAHLRVTDSNSDSYITALIKAARRGAEQEARCSLVTRSLIYSVEGFSVERDADLRYRFTEYLLLPEGPVISISGITYVDLAGDVQTMSASDYTLISGRYAHKVIVLPNKVSPVTAQREDAIRVAYSAGYGAASAVPECAKQYILTLIGSMYRYREMDSAQALTRNPYVDFLLDPVRQYVV